MTASLRRATRGRTLGSDETRRAGALSAVLSGLSGGVFADTVRRSLMCNKNF